MSSRLLQIIILPHYDQKEVPSSMHAERLNLLMYEIKTRKKGKQVNTFDLCGASWLVVTLWDDHIRQPWGAGVCESIKVEDKDRKSFANCRGSKQSENKAPVSFISLPLLKYGRTPDVWFSIMSVTHFFFFFLLYLLEHTYRATALSCFHVLFLHRLLPPGGFR